MPSDLDERTVFLAWSTTKFTARHLFLLLKQWLANQHPTTSLASPAALSPSKLQPISLSDPVLNQWQKTLRQQNIYLSFHHDQTTNQYLAAFNAPTKQTLIQTINPILSQLATPPKPSLALTIASAVQKALQQLTHPAPTTKINYKTQDRS
jgi:hypothetical protein